MTGAAETRAPAPGTTGVAVVSWPVTGTVAAAVAVTAACIVTGVGGTGTEVAVSDAAQGLAALFAGVSCLRVRPGGQGAGWASGWRLVGLGALAWAAGQGVWLYYEVIRGVATPPVSAADLGFLASMALGLAALSRLLARYRQPVLSLLEGLIVAGSLLYLSWVTVLAPAYHAAGVTDRSPLSWAVWMAYPVGDVATASMALVLLASAARRHRMPVALLAAGVLALAVSDTALLASAGSYQSGRLPDVGWLLGWALTGLAGLSAGTATRAAAGEDGTGSPHAPRGAEGSLTVMVLPYAPLVAGVAVATVLAARGGRPDPFPLLLNLALVLLVVARQVLVLRHNRDLAHRLAESLRELHREQARLSQLAFHDPLTGLANRAMFQDHAQNRAALGTGMAVCYLDLDGFKPVNDMRGHATGDALLIEVARRLHACVRSADVVARIGGDEFTILFDAVSPTVVGHVARRIIDAMREPFDLDGGPVCISASAGIALSTANDQVAVDELVRRADIALYAAKMSGKSRHIVYSPVMEAVAVPAAQPR